MNEKPHDLSGGFFRFGVLILGGVIALDLAIDVLQRIWVWLAVIATVIAVLWLLAWWLRHRAGRW